MILELIIYASLSLVVIASSAVLAQILQVQLSYSRHKKALDGLPILPRSWSAGGHMHQVFFASYNCFKIEALHRQYGKTFGFMYAAKPMASTVDLDLIKRLAVDGPKVNLNRADLSIPVKATQHHSIIYAKDDHWRLLRKAIAPGFTKHRLQSKNVQEEISDAIRKLVDSIEHRLDTGQKEANATGDTHAGAVINVSDLLLRYNTDLACSCIFKCNDTVDYISAVDKWTNSVDLGLQTMRYSLVELAVTFTWLGSIFDFIIMRTPLCTDVVKIITGFITQMTKLNKAAGQQMQSAMRRAESAGAPFDPDDFVLEDGTRFKRNMIDAFISNYNEGKVSYEDYGGSIRMLLAAGLKTSADASIRLIYYLASNMQTQEKLRRSIAESGSQSEYLAWCLNETLRLDPPGPFGCSRTTDRDLPVDGGGVIPKGTYVSTPAHTIHRMPEYWGEDAAVFRPERWAEADKFHPMQFIPFGAGLRICVGKDFALAEMKILFATLLSRYRFERCDETSDSPLFYAPFLMFTLYDVETYVKVTRLAE